MNAPCASAFYAGFVEHRRSRPRRHALRYGVFSMLIDLDEAPRLDAGTRFFGFNRFAALSFHSRDHGPRDGAPLRPWAEAALARAGLDMKGGPLRLLCYPRLFGYVFNPLSVFFCYDASENLRALIYEVGNTYGEKHSYVLPVDPAADGGAPVRQACGKEFYVSPFIAMETNYAFNVRPPGEDVRVAITQSDADGTFLHAVFQGRRRPFGAGAILALLARYPLMTFKVTAAIHWEALKLRLKGVPVHSHVSAPRHQVTAPGMSENR